jgi:hypothetical protein
MNDWQIPFLESIENLKSQVVVYSYYLLDLSISNLSNNKCHFNLIWIFVLELLQFWFLFFLFLFLFLFVFSVLLFCLIDLVGVWYV